MINIAFELYNYMFKNENWCYWVSLLIVYSCGREGVFECFVDLKIFDLSIHFIIFVRQLIVLRLLHLRFCFLYFMVPPPLF